MRSDFFNEAILTAMLFAMPQKYAQRQGADTGEEYNLHMHDTYNTSDEPQATIALRQKIMSLMDLANRAATMEGMPKEHIKIADFAASAFIDEILLSSSTWQGRLEWMKSPLQYLRHSTAIAGEFFFSILDNLLEASAEEALPKMQEPTARTLTLNAEEKNFDGKKTAENNTEDDTEDAHAPLSGGKKSHSLIAVLEVYALCLNQGFEGMYYNQPEVIESYLQKIGMVVPTVNHNLHRMFFFVPQKTAEKRKPKKYKKLLKKFDVLDYILWLIPAVGVIVFYFILDQRLDSLLSTFLQGVQS